MKKNQLIYTFIALVLLVTSCSDDDQDTSKEFRFLEFTHDVVLPSLSSREITFHAIDFDTNINNWELSLSDGTKEIPATLTKVEKTRFGWTGVTSRLQLIYVEIPALGIGDYTLTIKNNRTDQLYSDIFLIRSERFTSITSPVIASYSLGDTSGVVQDHLYFQNLQYAVDEGIVLNGIQRVLLETKETLNTTTLTHEVIEGNKELRFTIPLDTAVGSYYLAIEYNNGLRTYFAKDITVVEQQLPVLESVNKENFVEGDTLQLKGKNFRYRVDGTLLPTNGLNTVAVDTELVFRDRNRDFRYTFLGFKEAENFEDINAQGTELIFKIPNKVDSFMFTDDDETYFEGEVFVRSAGYESEPLPIRIEY